MQESEKNPSCTRSVKLNPEGALTPETPLITTTPTAYLGLGAALVKTPS